MEVVTLKKSIKYQIINYVQQSLAEAFIWENSLWLPQDQVENQLFFVFCQLQFVTHLIHLN